LFAVFHLHIQFMHQHNMLFISMEKESKSTGPIIDYFISFFCCVTSHFDTRNK